MLSARGPVLRVAVLKLGPGAGGSAGGWAHHAVPPPPPAAASTDSLFLKLRTKVNRYAEAQWEAVQTAPPRSIRGVVRRAADTLLRRIPPSEILLRHADCPPSTSLVLLHSPDATDEEVLFQLRTTAVQGEVTHKFWHRAAVGALLITIPLLVLPVPSLPLYWNIFRIYANAKAARGARRLAALLPAEPTATDWPACTRLGEAGAEAPAGGKKAGAGAARPAGCASDCCRLALASSRQRGDATVLPCELLRFGEGGEAAPLGVAEAALALPGLQQQVLQALTATIKAEAAAQRA